MSGGSGQPTSTTSTAPWKPAEGNLKLGLKDAKSLYDQKRLTARPMPGVKYIGMTGAERTGLNQMESLARRGNTMLPGILDNAREMSANNGLTGQQIGALDPLQDIASGRDNINTGSQYANMNRSLLSNGLASERNLDGLASGRELGVTTGRQYGQIANGILNRGLASENNLAGMARGNEVGITTGREYDRISNQMGRGLASENNLRGVANGNELAITNGRDYAQVANQMGRNLASENNLARMAQGKMVGESNPYLMGNLKNAASEAADAANAMFSAGGRYGSGANQGVVADQTGRIFSEGLGAQMNQDIANMMSANQSLDAAKLGRAGMNLNALQGQSNVQAQNMASRMSANQMQDAARMARAGMDLNAIQGKTGVQSANTANRLATNQMLDAARLNRTQTGLSALQGQTNAQSTNTANRMAANQMQDSAQMARTGAALSALQGQTGVQATNLANRAGAANSLQNVFQSGNENARAWASMAPQLRNMQFDDSNRLMQAGGAQRAEDVARQTWDQQRWDQSENRDINELLAFNALSQGTGQLGDSQSIFQQQGSPWAGILGGAMGGAQMGSMMGPWGTLGGGALGGLLGGFM